MAFTIGRAPPSSMAFAFEQPLDEDIPEVFHISALPYPPAPAAAFPLYLQWRAAGVNLGLPTVRVVDFIGPNIEATRGVGENYNVITVRVISQPSVFLTSRLYPVVAPEEMDSDLAVPMSGTLWLPPIEEMDADLAIPVSGTLIATLYATYTAAEDLNAPLAIPTAGTLVTVLQGVTMKAQEANADLAIPVSGTLVVVLIVYTNARADELNANLAIPQGGTLA